MSETIDDTDELRRHLHKDHIHPDGSVSIAAYKTKDMSLDLCRLRTLQESVASRPPDWGMAEFNAGLLRGLGLDVVHSPIKDDPRDPDNPAHCHVPGRINDGRAKKIRDAAQRVA